MSEQRKRIVKTAESRSAKAKRTSFIAIVLAPALASCVLFAQNQPDHHAAAGDASRNEAKATFEKVCASCHALDGRGGERGPDIASKAEAVRKTDAQLGRIIGEGKIAAGMPSFAGYGAERIAALVGYVRTLQGGRGRAQLPGDAARGKALFYGKAKCSECHMVEGRGGFYGADLTAYAAVRGADEVRAAIVSPGKDLDPRRGLITVTLKDSRTVSGMARNQDNFSLQLQTADGVFHLLDKADIRTLKYEGRLPMPANYGTSLSAKELDDVVSFLLQAAGSDNKRKASGELDDGEEE